MECIVCRFYVDSICGDDAVGYFNAASVGTCFNNSDGTYTSIDNANNTQESIWTPTTPEGGCSGNRTIQTLPLQNKSCIGLEVGNFESYQKYYVSDDDPSEPPSARPWLIIDTYWKSDCTSPLPSRTGRSTASCEINEDNSTSYKLLSCSDDGAGSITITSYEFGASDCSGSFSTNVSIFPSSCQDGAKFVCASSPDYLDIGEK